jgi:transposase
MSSIILIEKEGAMSFFAGIDLHSNNNYIGLINSDGEKLLQKKNSNSLDAVLETLDPFKKEIQGVVVESTYNWYWLIDGLMDSGYKVHLANPAAIQQYKGLKHVNDKTDSYWLSEMLRLNILPEGYIYPKEERGVRDLLRKRMLLVRHRTALVLSIQGMISNNTGRQLSRTESQDLNLETIELLLGETHHGLAAKGLQSVVEKFNEEIKKIETEVLKQVNLKPQFKKLLDVPGIGKILGIVIMLETGDINRFKSVGNYSSYCRCVSASHFSNGKKKSEGNKKNGNKYLSWAYVEATHYMCRFSPRARKWYQKKAAKKGNVVAIKALSNKIARACYYIIRDQQPFNPDKIFS